MTSSWRRDLLSDTEAEAGVLGCCFEDEVEAELSSRRGWIVPSHLEAGARRIIQTEEQGEKEGVRSLQPNLTEDRMTS